MQADRSADLITIGIDIGGSKTKIGLFKRGGQMVAKHVIPTGTKETGGVLQAIADKLHEVIERSPFGPADIGGIGLGVPGAVAKGGVVVECANIDMKEVYPPEEFKRIMPELEVPVRVCNNANAAALGEMFKGAGKGREDILLIRIGSGVGAGIIANGKIVTGFHGLSGEIGHICVNPDEKAPCGCGRYGCLEQYVAEPGMVRAVQRLLREHPEIPSPLRVFREGISESGAEVPAGLIPPRMKAKDIFNAAHNGDEIADFVVNQASDMLGNALAFAASVTAPEVILLGGDLSRAGSMMIDRVKATYQRMVYPQLTGIPIRLTALAGDAGMVGADYLIEEQIYGSDRV